MPTAKIHPSGRIAVYTTYAEKDLIKQVPGARFDGQDKIWTVPLSWAAVNQLRGVFGEKLISSDELGAWAWNEWNTRIEPSLKLRDQLTAEGDISIWRPYQLADIRWLLTTCDGLLANEPGTGKTVSVLTAARTAHLATGTTLPMLIVCPNSVKHHWERHFAYWFPEATPYRLGKGGATGRRKMLEAAMQDPTAAVIINMESVRLHSRVGPYGAIRLARCEQCFRKQDWIDLEYAQKLADEAEEQGLESPGRLPSPVPPSRCDVHRKELNEIPFQTVVLDEAHMVKEPTAKQTRACWQVMNGADVKWRWALTGTPIANHVGDLWSIMHGVANHEYPSKGEFTDRYALWTWDNAGNLTISDVRPDTKAELFSFLDPRFRRMLKDIVLPQLPPKVPFTYEAEMTPKQKKMYDQLEEEMYTRTPDGKLLLTTNNLTKNTRLLQLASSTAEIETPDPEKPENWEVHLVEPSSKVDVLMEIMEEYEGHQITVSAESRQLIDLAYDRLVKNGITAVQITGSVPEHERVANLMAFQTHQARVMLFTLGAGGVGIDMTASDTMVRLQRSYSMIKNVQGLGRIDRIGAEVHTSLNILDVIAPGTVEEDQLDRLRVKEERLESIARDRAARRAAGIDTSSLDAEEAMIVGGSLLPPLEEQDE